MRFFLDKTRKLCLFDRYLIFLIRHILNFLFIIDFTFSFFEYHILEDFAGNGVEYFMIMAFISLDELHVRADGIANPSRIHLNIIIANYHLRVAQIFKYFVILFEAKLYISSIFTK